MKITYTYYQKGVRYNKSGAPVQVHKDGQTYEGAANPIRWQQFLVDEMANYIDLQASIDELNAELSDGQTYLHVEESAKAVFENDIAEGRAPKDMRPRDRKERIADNVMRWKAAMNQRLEGYKRDFEAAGITLADMRGDYVAPAFWCYDHTIAPEQKAAITAELSKLYTGVKINDLDAVAALEAGLNAVWQRYDLAQHDIAIIIKWRRPSDPEKLAKMEAAAAKRAKSTKARKAYTPLKPAKVGSRLLASIQHCDPGLTAIEKAVLVCLALSDSSKEDITKVKDLKELVAPRKDKSIPLTAQWFESRVIDLFQRGGRWQEGQDPDALKMVLVNTLEGLTKDRKITFWDSEGDKYTMEGQFLARTKITNETKQVGAIFYAPCTLFSFLKQQKYDIINPDKFCKGLKKGGEIYTALRCEIGSWQPMLSRGNNITIPIAGLLPEYNGKKDGEKEGTAKKRRYDTRKKLQREADRITEEEGGVDITISANNKGEANITITPN